MSTLTAAAPRGARWLWDRQLPHYPDTNRRMAYLGITVAATITLPLARTWGGTQPHAVRKRFPTRLSRLARLSAVGARAGRSARRLPRSPQKPRTSPLNRAVDSGVPFWDGE